MVLADYLGISDMWGLSEGSTGYTTNGGVGTAKTTFVNRITNCSAMRCLNPAIVVLAGGVNDAAASGATIQAAVTAAITAAQTAWPNALIVVLGTWTGNTLVSQALSLSLEPYIQAAVTAANSRMVQFVPVMTDPNGQWIKGTGNTTTPGTGGNAGNADYLFDAADGTHWNYAGHLINGKRVADGISSAIRYILGYEA